MKLSFNLCKVCGLALLCVSAACSAPPPDVVLISIDTLRADRLGAYGWEEAHTPVIDELAERGTVFTRAYTPLPRTTPGLASLLTGLEPHRHGSREVGQPMRFDVPTLAEVLADHGWATVGVSASVVAGPGQGLDRGFQRFVRAGELPSTDAGNATARALAEVQALEGPEPLFLWLHTIDPHLPYKPPAPWGNGPRGDGCREVMAFGRQRGWGAGHLYSDREGRAARALDSCSFLYDAEIAYGDDKVGVLLRGLELVRPERPRWVILTSDHGENLGEDGLYYQHGPSLHDASLRVPLIFAGPGVPPGRRVADLVTLQDVVPTLLRRLGIKPPEAPEASFDGVDVGRLLGWGPFSRFRRSPRWEVFAESGSALMEHNFRYLRSGRVGGFHCLNVRRWSLCERPGETPRLFDHEADPDLTVDLSTREPETYEALKALGEVWPPEEARSRTVLDGRFKLVELPVPRGGYRRVLYELEEEAGTFGGDDVSARYPDEWRELGRRLEAWTSALPGPAPPERSEEDVDRLRALGYAGGG